jgi:4-hydroxybenzoate polyprenyltransferase
VRALVSACHPAPCVAVPALTALLAAQAAPHGVGPVLTGPALLAGQLSIGWSNDARDAARDTEAGRLDKPIARGEIGVPLVWAAACAAAAAGLAMALLIGPVTAGLYALGVVLGWSYNLGLKSTPWSWVAYLLAFASLPAYAASTLPGDPAPRWTITVAAGLIGFGAHFANVLPDLSADEAAGVRGLPQRVAARWGPGTVRATAVAALLAASALLLVGATRRWVAVPGLVAAVLLAVASARGTGRVPFLAAIGIAAVDVVLFIAGGESLA